MNPVDHPLGGGEGKAPVGVIRRQPVGQAGGPDPQEEQGKRPDTSCGADQEGEEVAMARSLKKGPFVDEHLLARSSVRNDKTNDE